MKLAPSRLPARTRLTLWYVLLLSATQLALGSLALWLVERTLYANADELLRTRAAAVQTEIDVVKGRLFLSGSGSGTRLPRVAAGLDVVRLWDRSGRAVFDYQGPAGLPPVDPAAVGAILADRTEYSTAPAADASGVRLYMEPVREKDEIVGVIQVGRSLAEVEAILNRLRLLGGIGLLVALALAWGGGYFLAGRALAPVDRITRAAERIGAEDLSRRLALRLPDDELGRLAAAFDGMIDRLERAFRRQRQFTADASHELRTPLAIIRSQLELARGRPREAAYDRRVLDSIHEETERLGHLVENLLILARADAGRPLEQAPLDLEELLAEAGERMAPLAHERGIALEATADETAAVRGDAVRLGQLLLNLLDNALRHTPSGGRVTVSLEPAAAGVLLKVADTGCGIAPEHLPRIFERFYRADEARSRAAGGAGLGLAICEAVARAHGGRLEVESEVGRGTTFSLWLPAASAGGDGAGPRPRTAHA